MGELKLYRKECWSSYKGFKYFYQISHSENPIYPAALFLCGAFQSSASWMRFEQDLIIDRDVIIIEMPGVGRSDLFPENFGLAAYREILLDLLETLDYSHVYLISGSYGTIQAYDFAQYHPERIDRLVLAGTMTELSSELRNTLEYSISLLKKGKLSEFVDLVLQNLARDRCGQKNSKIVRRVLKRQLERYSSDDQAKYIENTRRLLKLGALSLECPPPIKTMVFTGEFDVFTRPELCKEVAGRIPGSQYISIRDAGHLFHMEQFHVCINLIRAFSEDKKIDMVAGCIGYESY